MHSLNGVKNMKRFVVVRAEGYIDPRWCHSHRRHPCRIYRVLGKQRLTAGS